MLDSIKALWPHCNHALLGNLKAQQENLLGSPADALQTLWPFLEGSWVPAGLSTGSSAVSGCWGMPIRSTQMKAWAMNDKRKGAYLHVNRATYEL